MVDVECDQWKESITRGVTLAQQAEAEQFFRQLVDVVLVASLPPADRDDHDDDFPPLDAIDDAVPLPNGANAAEPRQLSDQRLALLGRLSELVHTLTDEPPEPLIWDGLGVPERRLRPLDRVNGVGHRPRRFLASALLTRRPCFKSSMLSRSANTISGSLSTSSVSTMLS